MVGAPFFYLDLERHHSYHYICGHTITQSSDFSAHCPDYLFDCILVYGIVVVYFCYGGHCHDWHWYFFGHQSCYGGRRAVVSGAYFGDKCRHFLILLIWLRLWLAPLFYTSITWSLLPFHILHYFDFFYHHGLYPKCQRVGGRWDQTIDSCHRCQVLHQPGFDDRTCVCHRNDCEKNQAPHRTAGRHVDGWTVCCDLQPSLVAEVAKVPQLDFNAAYKGVMENMVTDTSIEMNNEKLNSVW